LSLLGKMVRDEPLTELDQLILGSMDKVEELGQLMVELAGIDPIRCEALLHAWPPGPNVTTLPQRDCRGSPTAVAAGMRLKTRCGRSMRLAYVTSRRS